MMPEPYPAPEVTSRDPWDGSGAPSPVTKLAESASKLGWAVRVQRSKGRLPNRAHGAPGALKWLHAVVLRAPGGRRAAYAVYDGASWGSVMLWGAGMTWFPLASVTDLKHYLEARGEVTAEWLDSIRLRESDAEARRQARMACDRGAHPLAAWSDVVTMSCPTCLRSWQGEGEPWRKPRVGRSEAL